MPKSVVIDSCVSIGGRMIGPPGLAMSELIIYETHVKGFSQLWEELPKKIRGTYSGIGSEAAIKYFQELGVTAVRTYCQSITGSIHNICLTGDFLIIGVTTLLVFSRRTAVFPAVVVSDNRFRSQRQ